jgi:hypothetical protein
VSRSGGGGAACVKSTLGPDAGRSDARMRIAGQGGRGQGTQLTCFIGKKVQILTQVQQEGGAALICGHLSTSEEA